MKIQTKTKTFSTGGFFKIKKQKAKSKKNKKFGVFI